MLSPGLSEAPEVAASGCRIRPARRSDEAFIVTLTTSTFLAYGSYDRFVADWLRDERVITHVAEHEGRRAGFAMTATYEDPDRPDKTVADLVAIAVEPEAQRRGVGQALLDAAVASLPDAIDEMWLVVADTNARAQRFFARNRFRPGAGVGVYPAGQRALRMVKHLDRPRPGPAERRKS